jgi:O-acetylhomoserine/O-acetylserine sulfhydrylase-like pyridoxal-dependent enzyme
MHYHQAEEFASLIDEKTRAVYIETIGNPSYNCVDFEGTVLGLFDQTMRWRMRTDPTRVGTVTSLYMRSTKHACWHSDAIIHAIHQTRFSIVPSLTDILP